MRLTQRAAFSWLKGMAPVLLALAVVLRIAATPFVMASPAPDVMVICAGGKIIYISMVDGQPVEGEDHPATEACPFFGIMSALPVSDGPDLRATVLAVAVGPTAHSTPAFFRRAYRDYQSRAPPVSI